MPRTTAAAKPQVRYYVGLPNGLETYAADREEATRIFHECAAEGECSLGFIRKCARYTLARSIARTFAPTLGHYERAVQRVIPLKAPKTRH